MNLNGILESLGEDPIHSSGRTVRLEEELTKEEKIALQVQYAKDAEERKRKATITKRNNTKKRTGTTNQGKAKSNIIPLWDDELIKIGDINTPSDRYTPTAPQQRLLIKGAGDKTTSLSLLKVPNEISDTSHFEVQACVPKYFGTVKKSDVDMEEYINMPAGGELAGVPLDIKLIGEILQTSKTSGTKDALSSSTSVTSSKITNWLGFNSNGLLARWLGISGEFTYKITRQLANMCSDYIKELQGANGDKAFNVPFDWNSLRDHIEGIIIDITRDSNSIEAFQDKYMGPGIEELIAFQFLIPPSKQAHRAKPPTTFKPSTILKEMPVPLDCVGKDSDGMVGEETLSKFVAYRTTQILQDNLKYKKEKNTKTLTIAKYLSSASTQIGILTNLEVPQKDIDGDIDNNLQNGNSLKGDEKYANNLPNTTEKEDAEEVIKRNNGGVSTLNDSVSAGHYAREAFGIQLDSINENKQCITLRNEFSNTLERINEASGAGRGLGLRRSNGTIRDAFSSAMKYMAYHVLNKSTHRIFSIEPYDFNNFYTLDLRIDTDVLLNFFGKGKPLYDSIFAGLYPKTEYDRNLKIKILTEYAKFYKESKKKSVIRDPSSVPEGDDEWDDDDDIFESRKNPLLYDEDAEEEEDEDDKGRSAKELNPPSAYKHLSLKQLKKALHIIYDEIGVVSLFEHKGKELITIKEEAFVDLIMTGLASAIRGNVPQGVTIEEILAGKFSRKAITPDQGTFINRVKDPTSDKEFDFRSWSSENLQTIHEMILNIFKRAAELKTDVETDKHGGTFTRDSILLYMTQDDFHQLEKGGQGLANIAKGLLKNLKQGHVDINI